MAWKLVYHVTRQNLILNPAPLLLKKRFPSARQKLSDAALLQQTLLCSWTSGLQLSANGRQTYVRLDIQPFQTVAEYFFTWSVGRKRGVNIPSPCFSCTSEIHLLTYLLTYSAATFWTHRNSQFVNFTECFCSSCKFEITVDSCSSKQNLFQPVTTI